MEIKPIGTILLPNWITPSGYTFGTIDNPTLVRLTDSGVTINGTLDCGAITGERITISSPTPILVFKDNTYVGDVSLGYIEWRDSTNTRLGFFGNSSSFNDDLLWKNESAGGHIKIETTGAGEFQVFANTVITGTLDCGAITSTGLLEVSVAGNAAIFQNTTDAASNQVAQFKAGNRTAPDFGVADDEGYMSLFCDNDAGTQMEMVRLKWIITQVDAGSEEGAFDIQLESSGGGDFQSILYLSHANNLALFDAIVKAQELWTKDGTSGHYLKIVADANEFSADRLLEIDLNNNDRVVTFSYSPLIFDQSVNIAAIPQFAGLIITKTDVPAFVEVGQTNTNQFAIVDLKGDATYTDYGLRIIRYNTGANTDSRITHRGTGPLYLVVEDAGSIILQTSNITRMTVDSAGDVTLTGTLAAGRTTITGDGIHGIILNQGADLKGLEIYGHADVVGNFFKLYVDAAGSGWINSNHILKFYALYDIDLWSATGSVNARLGDAVGVQKFKVRDSGAGIVATIDSDGNAVFNGRISSATLTFSTEGPTDNLDVSGINSLLINTSGNNVTIGGFVGGVVGQELRVVVIDATNNATLENIEGTGNQDIYLHAGADETLDGHYGGWNLVCDGTHWYDESHAKHV